ncbi:hypothetical protein ACH4U6_21290 [Streptomyces netropsis]|uniref:hypothetical protein n=1 Tax=Streptomyces netropsis TaxID=55404 RepID=UPI0037BC5F1B
MKRSLLTPRSALVLLLGVLTGLGAGVLSGLSGVDAARCVLFGGGVFGAAVSFFDRLVADSDA